MYLLAPFSKPTMGRKDPYPKSISNIPHQSCERIPNQRVLAPIPVAMPNELLPSKIAEVGYLTSLMTHPFLRTS